VKEKQVKSINGLSGLWRQIKNVATKPFILSLQKLGSARAPANPTLQSFFLILSVDKTTVNTAKQMEILQNLICRKQTNSSPRKFQEKIHED
jgi:hypothetical protein